MSGDQNGISMKEYLTERFDRVETELGNVRLEAREQRTEDRAWRSEIETRLTALERWQWRVIGGATIGAGILAAAIQQLFFG